MTLFEGKEGVALYQAIALKHAMKLSALGVQPGRGWTRKAMIALAAKITGATYKSGAKGFGDAQTDVSAWIEKQRSAG